MSTVGDANLAEAGDGFCYQRQMVFEYLCFARQEDCENTSWEAGQSSQRQLDELPLLTDSMNTVPISGQYIP